MKLSNDLVPKANIKCLGLLCFPTKKFFSDHCLSLIIGSFLILVQFLLS